MFGSNRYKAAKRNSYSGARKGTYFSYKRKYVRHSIKGKKA